MNRQEHEAEVRSRIIKSARLLFLEHGYHQTTIRQIKAAADVNTGTLYHFYSDKEDIFFNIVKESFLRATLYTEKMVPKGAKMLHQACEIAWHIHVMAHDAASAELYLISYNSPRIADELIKAQSNRSQEVFGNSTQGLKVIDHNMRAMMTKGFLQSVAQNAVQGKLIDTNAYIEYGITLFFRLFDVPESDINQTLKQLADIDVKSHVEKNLA